MRVGTLVVTSFAFASVLVGQTEPSVAPEWDIRTNMQSLVADVRLFEPLLRRLDPEHWVKRGAPEAYVQQLTSSQQAMEQLNAATDQLSRSPEKLSAALNVFFELERMETLMKSLRDGARKWQSEDLSNRITEALAANTTHHERLRQHVRDLAVTREQEFHIMNQEAQRCRGMLTKQPPPEVAPRGSSGRSQNRRARQQ
jgi:site-specific recombinase